MKETLDVKRFGVTWITSAEYREDHDTINACDPQADYMLHHITIEFLAKTHPTQTITYRFPRPTLKEWFVGIVKKRQRTVGIEVTFMDVLKNAPAITDRHMRVYSMEICNEQ